MIAKVRHTGRSLAPLTGALMVASFLGGCASQLERAPVELHAAPTTKGVGWSYRAPAYEIEEILTGERREFDVDGDAARLAEVWRPLHGRVSVQKDSTSDYILVKLGNKATGHRNPIRGGFHSWGLHVLQEKILEGMSVVGRGGDQRYSVHLVALGDDGRPTLEEEAVAQVRLRRLASLVVEAGADPRLVTGQTWAPREETPWLLALVLRPYRYGDEKTSGALVAPGSF